jgi:hypothetical protein
MGREGSSRDPRRCLFHVEPEKNLLAGVDRSSGAIQTRPMMSPDRPTVSFEWINARDVLGWLAGKEER